MTADPAGIDRHVALELFGIFCGFIDGLKNLLGLTVSDGSLDRPPDNP